MKTAHRHLIFSIFITISLVAFSQHKLIILHTNDTHSRIEPLPETDRTFPNKGGVVRRATYIQQVRENNKNVLLFDAGDFLQGTPYFNLFKGEVEVEAMNLMGYDAVTLGNHEFDYGLEVLADVARRAKFPIISTNYDFSDTELKGLIEPYMILNRNGVKIGIIGINIQPMGLVATQNYKGVSYLDPVETANKTAKLLRKRKKCDIIICLSHLGHVSDLRLAELSNNIDLILGGHSHTYIEEPVLRNNTEGKDVMIFQTNGRGVYVGRIDVTLEKIRK